MARRKRIVILGGGLAGVSTALFLSDPGNPRNRAHKITIYQMGWRLGGKCASGRNFDAKMGGRIEEHGLHIMLGFYENLFRMVRAMMAEWNMPPNHLWQAPDPDDRWRNAFTRANFAPLVEPNKDGTWTIWPLRFPDLPGEPGDGRPPRDDLIEFLFTLDDWLNALHDMAKDPAPDQCLKECLRSPHKDEAIRERVRHSKEHRPLSLVTLVPIILGVIRLLLLGLKREGMHKWRRSLKTEDGHIVDRAEMLYTFIDLGSALFCGLVINAPRIYWGTLDVLDSHELRDFLHKYGADRRSLESPVVDTLYDAAFASRRGTGKRKDEKLAAGVAIRSLINILVGYKGSPWWKMNAGMGDTIFAPAYEVLKSRGVEFRFFHRVRNIALTADKKAVQHIDLGVQHLTKDPVTGQQLPPGVYDPLAEIDANGARVPRGQGVMLVWPNKPLKESMYGRGPSDPVVLEDPDAKTNDVAKAHLHAGTDFDTVVLAIPIGVLPSICSELVDASSKFRDMVNKVRTVKTVAYQIWLSKDLKQLGWKLANAPVLGNFRDPLNTWVDMSHLLKVEGPQNGRRHPPRSVQYFCGPMPEHVTAAQAMHFVATEAKQMLNELASNFLAKALTGTPPRFNTRLRISEYLRANFNSAERYTLSLPGTTEYRLRVDESGFSNLIFAGDWTRNNFNIGAAEPTVMSAMQASNAICGWPAPEQIARNNGP